VTAGENQRIASACPNMAHPEPDNVQQLQSDEVTACRTEKGEQTEFPIYNFYTEIQPCAIFLQLPREYAECRY
jgi:hypothetical protein